MIVHYYEVMGCVLDTFEGTPVLIAPLSTDPNLLKAYSFTALPDGRQAHFLTLDEYQYIQSFDPNTPAVSFVGASPAVVPEDNQRGNWLSTIALGLMIVGILLLFSAFVFTRDWTNFVNLLGVIGSLCRLAAWVLVIIVRVKYPKNKFGKVLLIIFITLYLLALIAAIIVGIMCAMACESCLSEIQRCPG